jgi:hypothetical protein
MKNTTGFCILSAVSPQWRNIIEIGHVIKIPQSEVLPKHHATWTDVKAAVVKLYLNNTEGFEIEKGMESQQQIIRALGTHARKTR